MGDREASAMEMAEDESVEMGEGESGGKFQRWRWLRVNQLRWVSESGGKFRRRRWVRNFGDGDEASNCEKFRRWEKFPSSEY